MNHFNINLQTTQLMGWVEAGQPRGSAPYMYLLEPNNIIKFKTCDSHVVSWAVWEPALDPKQALLVASKCGGEFEIEEQRGGFYFVSMKIDGELYERRERTLALGYCMVALDYWERKRKK